MPDPAPALQPADPSDADEQALLRALREGRDDAYETMVRMHGPRMFAVIRRILRDEELAHDALQDAFLSAFKAIGSFHGDSKLSTWLHKIAVNAALMQVRNKKRLHERSIDDLLPRFKDDGHEARPNEPWADSAEKLAERDEARELVRAFIDELPETHRMVLLLRDIEELSTEETAQLLGVTANAVKIRLHRARQALRTRLDERLRVAPVP